jgi:HSP20 family protein
MQTRNLARREDLYPSLLNEFFNPWNDILPSTSRWGNMMNAPAVNIKENDNMFTISVAAPGLVKNDFSIKVENNTLSVSCEKETQKDESKDEFTRQEYNYSSFCRTFALPEDVNANNIEASYENGILKLVLPKKEEAIKSKLSRSIAVK